MIEFRKLFKGESLAQQDLVAWVNLGMHYFTRAEDIPNTLMLEAHSSITFAPHNCGHAELTIDMTNATFYDKDKGQVKRQSDFNDSSSAVEPETNGANPPVCMLRAS